MMTERGRVLNGAMVSIKVSSIMLPGRRSTPESRWVFLKRTTEQRQKQQQNFEQNQDESMRLCQWNEVLHGGESNRYRQGMST